MAWPIPSAQHAPLPLLLQHIPELMRCESIWILYAMACSSGMQGPEHQGAPGLVVKPALVGYKPYACITYGLVQTIFKAHDTNGY